MQVSMGSFKFLLNRQKEYVETAMGLGRCADSVLPDEGEFILRAATPREVAKNVLRLIDFIVCLLM
jgi:hypothetical protein